MYEQICFNSSRCSIFHQHVEVSLQSRIQPVLISLNPY